MKTKKFKKLDLLISFYITCLILSELMGMKTFPLVNILGYQFNASVAIFTFPIIFTINDLVIEVYGRERVKSIVRSGLAMIAFITIFSIFATKIAPSSRFSSSETHYDYIFYKSIRMSVASLTAFIVSELFDILIFVKIREKLGQNKLWIRSNLSNLIAQFFDTSLFMALAFYDIHETAGENIDFLLGLILPYWLLKCSMSVIGTPFLYAGIKWLKNDSDRRGICF